MNDVTQIATTKPRKRCAVYCWVSSDERLDQEFNSIDAQKEAGHAYVASQRAEGWIPVADDYDDPGYSGGNTDRPGLKRLMADIERGQIDIVVVYKIDRLTRSLADFSKIVEVFERQSVSFVSVTQQFNTTTSMGRLMLNVLLSFAQFEREVTGERIRDKIAAAKRKGMWMGGVPPLGYDVDNRLLVINEAEAAVVRHTQANGSQIDEASTVMAMGRLNDVWDHLFPVERHRIVNLMIERIDLVHAGELQGIKVKWRELGWDALIGEFAPAGIGAELVEIEG